MMVSEFWRNCKSFVNLISYGNEDDQFDWTEGWIGTSKLVRK
jgi:hypothetical protein